MNQAPKISLVCASLERRKDRQFVFERMFPILWDLPVSFFPAVDGSRIPEWRIEQIREKFKLPLIKASTWAVRLTKRLVLREFLRSKEDFLLFMEDDCLLLPHFQSDLEKLLTEMPRKWQLAFLGGQMTPEVVADAKQGEKVRPFPGSALNHCILFSRAGAAKTLKLLNHPRAHANSDEEIKLAIQSGRLNAWWCGRFAAVQRTSHSNNAEKARRGRTELPSYKMMAGTDDVWLLSAAVCPGDKVLEWGSGGSTCHLAHQAGPSGKVFSYEHQADFALKTEAALKEAGLQDRVELNYVPPKPVRRQDLGTFRMLPGQMANYVIAPFADLEPGTVDVAFIDGRERMRCAMVALELLRPGGFLLIHDFWGRHRYREKIGWILSKADLVCSTLVSEGGERIPPVTDLVLFQKRETN